MIRVRRHISEGLTVARLRLEVRRAARPALIYAGMVVLGLAAMAGLLSRVNIRYPWEHPRTYRVAVADASGVRPGLQDVRISGLKVGRITGMRLAGGRAVLTLSIDRRYGPLYRDARVQLRPQTPLQDLYVDVVDRGTRAAGQLGSAVLGAQRSTSPVDLSDVLDTFDADTRARLKALIDELGAGIDGRGARFRAALTEVAPFLRSGERLTRQLAARKDQTQRLVHDLRLLTAELGTRDRRLTRLVSGASATLGAVAGERGALGRILDDLPPTFTRLRTSFATVRRALDETDPALEALRPTARALGPGLRALGSITRAATPALDALRRPVRALRPTAQRLAPTAAALDGAFASLRPQAPRLDRITARMVPCELALQKFFQNTPSVFKLSDAYGILPRGDAVTGTEVAGGTIRSPNYLDDVHGCADKAPGP